MRARLDSLLRPRDVAEYLGVSVVTIWRMRRRGDFPEPIRISPGAVGWRAADIEAWLRSRDRRPS
jgi:predicted DNA-binding transcriptional regulator AlpA